MDLAERYRAAVTAAFDPARDDAGLLPEVLARACVAVLPVEGAGITVTQDLRVPLGASDEVALRAERLQTTLGEGPCLEAVLTPLPLTAGLDALHQRWPAFAAEFVGQTPYRSVASLPLIPPRGGRRLGALDLYRTDAEPMDTQLLFQLATSVGSPVAAMLAGAPVGEDAAGITMPVWLDTDLVHGRMDVWGAVGRGHGGLVADEPRRAGPAAGLRLRQRHHPRRRRRPADDGRARRRRGRRGRPARLSGAARPRWVGEGAEHRARGAASHHRRSPP